MGGGGGANAGVQQRHGLWMLSGVALSDLSINAQSVVVAGIYIYIDVILSLVEKQRMKLSYPLLLFNLELVVLAGKGST